MKRNDQIANTGDDFCGIEWLGVYMHVTGPVVPGIKRNAQLCGIRRGSRIKVLSVWQVIRPASNPTCRADGERGSKVYEFNVTHVTCHASDLM
jgi:hypothetical protein